MPEREMSGSSPSPGVLHTGHGAAAPQPQASDRLLKSLLGFSGWFSQTHPVSSQNSHLGAAAMDT
jgi:hypothetical protein